MEPTHATMPSAAGLLRAVVPAAIAILLAGSLIGGLLAGWQFAVGCLVAGGTDIVSVSWWSDRAAEVSDPARAPVAQLLVARFVVRAAALAGAAVVSRPALLGAVAGAVAYDVALMTVGSVSAAKAAFRPSSNRGGERHA